VEVRHADEDPGRGAAGRETYGLKVLERTLAAAGCDDEQANLRELRQWLFEGLIGLAREFDGMGIDASSPLEQRAARFILDLPGKRLRPLCALVASRIGEGWRSPVVRDVAVAAEMVHNATLLHDDVIDLGTERRGLPCARVVYGNAASVLGGDFLLVRAVRRIHRHGRPELVFGLLDVVEAMVDAEAEQLELRGRMVFDRERYLRIVQGKTASLFRWSLSGAAQAAGAPEAHVKALETVGACMGVAFQLVDDLLDVEGDAEALGKDLFADLEEGKMTWPFIIAAERAPSFVATLEGWMRDHRAGEAGRPDAVLALLVETEAAAATRAFAVQQSELALDALRTLPPSPARTILEVIVQAIVHRRQ